MKSRVRRIVTSSSRPFRFVAHTEKPTVREDRLARILGYCVALVAILGIPSGLWGYFAGEHGKRVQNTFEFYKDFRSQAFQDKYQALVNAMEKKDEAIDRIMSDLRDNVAERDKQVLAVIVEVAEAGDMPKNMSTALLFFDGLAACVKNGLCDRNAAGALFQVPSRELGSYYGPYILFIRAKYGNEKYGTGLFQTRALETEWSLF